MKRFYDFIVSSGIYAAVIVVYLAVVLVLLGFAVIFIASNARASDDPRYGGSPVRNADGSIHRSTAVYMEFRSWHPCPSTGMLQGPCAGWQVNHVIPLACGGKDVPFNMQWLPVSIKTCTDIHCIDRHERKINAHIPSFPDTATCVNVIVN